MPSEIIKFKDDAGDLVEFSKEDIRQRLCRNATDGELAMCIELCNRRHLNPFTGEVFLIKYGNQPAQLVVSYHVFNRRACKMPNYDGIQSGVVVMRDGQIVRKKGSAVYKVANEQLIGGWATVYYKDKTYPVEVELALDNFSTGRSNWSKMPGLMIEKCAKATAWRTAFPSEFMGMYISEEMQQAEPKTVQAETETVRPVDLQPLRDLFKPFCSALDLHASDAMALICKTVKAEDMDSMTENQARRAVSYMEEEIAAALANQNNGEDAEDAVFEVIEEQE